MPKYQSTGPGSNPGLVRWYAGHLSVQPLFSGLQMDAWGHLGRFLLLIVQVDNTWTPS